VGSVANLGAVLGFSDMLILCMALPNIVGSALLVPVIQKRLVAYFGNKKTAHP
jgi:Na+/alanine symporter